MHTLNANRTAAAARATIWSRFAGWAYRTLDRVPSHFEDVDPAVFNRVRPY